MVDSAMGRRRKYCKRSCRQRAYEQRAQLVGTSIPEDSVVLSPTEVADFGDRMFELRCAAEDLATAVAEKAGHDTLTELTESLLALARDAERLR